MKLKEVQHDLQKIEAQYNNDEIDDREYKRQVLIKINNLSFEEMPVIILAELSEAIQNL